MLHHYSNLIANNLEAVDARDAYVAEGIALIKSTYGHVLVVKSDVEALAAAVFHFGKQFAWQPVLWAADIFVEIFYSSFVNHRGSVSFRLVCYNNAFGGKNVQLIIDFLIDFLNRDNYQTKYLCSN